MNHRLPGTIAVVLALGTPPAIAAQQPASPADRFLGVWEGAIQVGPSRLRLGLTVDRDSVGALRAVMTSIDQGAMKVPSTVSTRGDTIIVAMPLANAGFRGVITAADTLKGTFSQGAPLPLTFHRTTALSTLNRPQTPKPPFPYRTEEVSFESVPGVRLAGTVIVPAGPGPFPAVVFVTGSGAQDRDESLLGHQPFLVVADYLARHGIASLRCDDRGFAHSTGNFEAATTLDFADDAEAAVHFLQGNSAIARDRVGILGHSEGGMIGPIVAARSRDVAFLVLLAGPGIPSDSVMTLQQRLVASAAGVPASTIEAGASINHAAFGALKAGGDSAAIAARLRTAIEQLFPTLPAAERQQTSPDEIMKSLTPSVLTPWFRYFITYDPRPTLRRVTVPVLALNGTLDVQVPYKEDLDGIETALKEGGNRDYKVVALPGLNHLFQTAITGGVAEYSTIEETIAPVALETITQWIVDRFGHR